MSAGLLPDNCCVIPSYRLRKRTIRQCLPSQWSSSRAVYGRTALRTLGKHHGQKTLYSCAGGQRIGRGRPWYASWTSLELNSFTMFGNVHAKNGSVRKPSGRVPVLAVDLTCRSVLKVRKPLPLGGCFLSVHAPTVVHAALSQPEQHPFSRIG